MYKKTNLPGVFYYPSRVRKHKGKPDKCYYIRYSRNGKKTREKIGWQSEGFSAHLASQIRAERISGHYKEKQSLTVEEAVKKYINAVKANKASWKDDQHRLKPFLDDYGQSQINDITPGDIESYINRIKKGNRKPATVKQYLQVVRRLFNYLNEQELFDKQNPAARVKVSVPDNTVVEALTPEECERLQDVCLNSEIRYNGGYVILFALYTGLRASSLFRLKWEDVDLKKKSIRLKKTKNRRQATILLSDLAVDLLESLDHNDEYVFPSPFGGQRKDIRRVWKKVKREAEIRPHIRFHDLRHTFATMLAEKGVDLDVISRMLTHSSIVVTQKYAHIRDKRLKKATGEIDNIFRSDDPEQN